MELYYHNKSKYQVKLYSPVIYICKLFVCRNRAKAQTKQECSPFVPGTPPNHLTYIYMFNFIYTSPPIFISPFFFLNFFCPVVIIQQMMPRVQTILKPRTLPFVKAYGGIASFFFGKIFYETL